ncbi:PTS sugar transporter subunit IIC [Cetobacterium somerae]|uniref:PTS sugar transporter subunit IIC n=1 Tax=Cetobacterium somerae TaxID=188913 RepID=UPI003D769A3C
MKIFDKFNIYLNKHFVPVANKIATQRHVIAIKDGVVATMPLTIVGSLFLILSFLPIPGYSDFINSSGIGRYFSYISGACFGIVGMVACLAVAYRLTIGYGMNELALSNGIIAVASFFVTMLPTAVDGKIDTGYLGAKSLFAGVIIALISVELIKKIVDRGLVITLPESVPPAISKTFMSLIPGVIVISFWGLLTAIFVNTSFANFHDAVNIIVGTPLRYASTSLLGQLVAVVLTTILWCAGIHGATIVGAIMDPIWLENTLHNAALASQGVENLYSNGYIIASAAFGDMTMKLGGSGSTIGFVLLMLFRARSKQLKEVGKLSITPSLFNINEPVIFGTPIVMNPILIIPFILNPILITLISWFLMRWDIVKIPFSMVPWTTPPVVAGFLAAGFSVSTALLSLFSIVLSIIVFYPFFKLYDAQLEASEKEVKKEESLESLLSEI